MRALRDPKMDDKIRATLRVADKMGKLSVIAAVVGIAGGESAVRQIMNSEGELPIMDRGMFALHLNLLK